MAEKEKTKDKGKKDKVVTKQVKQVKESKKESQSHDYMESLIRVYGYDIPGSKNIFTGLTKIKGISWAVSNAICESLKIPKTKKISEFSKEELGKIESFLDNIQIPDYMKNRRFDMQTGETKHYFGTDLDVVKDFDIKRLKKIRSWKGVRHTNK